MLSLRAKNTMIVVAIILFSVIATQSVKAQRDVDLILKAESTVDVCGDRSLVVTIDAGDLSVADSVLLYDIAIKYDAQLLRFVQVLTVGTLSENLQQKGSNNRDTGQVRVFGFNVTQPIAGKNRPLVGLVFTFRGSCTDTNSKIEIVPAPDINVEAKIRYKKLGSFIIPVTILNKPERKLTMSLMGDTTINELSTELHKTLRVTFPLNSGMLETRMSVKHDARLNTKSVTASGSMDTLTWNQIDSVTTRVVLRQKNNSVLQSPQDIQFSFGIKGLEELNTKMYIDSVSYTQCACISATQLDTIQVKRNKLSTVGDDTNNKVSLQTSDEFIKVESTSNIDKIEIYSILGNKIWSGDMLNTTHIQIDWSSWVRGIYMIRTMTSGENKDILLYK